MANAQISLAKIEDSIECSVCAHRFREPKWLNCFHTFCLQCLQEICKNQGPQCKKLPCPLCRQETILTNGNVSDLLDNSDMKAFVETFTQQENVLKQQFEQLHDFPELVAKCRRSKTEFELSVKNLDNLIEKLYKVFCDMKEKISKKATWEVSRIRDEEQKLIKEAENIHKNKVEFLKSLQASDRREATQTAHKLDEVNRLMSGGSNGSKGQDFKKRICKDLEKATMKHPQSVPDGLIFMDFKENNQGSLGELVQNDDDMTLHRNWVPRRDTDNPKTLEQIHQDYKRDEERKKMEGLQAQMAPPPQRMSRNKRDQPQRVGPPPPEGWSTVTSTKATRVAVYPNKFKVMKQQSIDDDIQLGPGPRSFGGWSRGSSGGSSKTQSESQEPKQSNRFMMLSDDRKGRVSDFKGRGPQSLQGKRSSSSRERDEMSKERRSAIAEVQKISQARRSQSREKDLDSRGSRDKQEPAPVSAPVKEVPRASVQPAISEDVFEKKAMATIEEYLNIKDIEEALTCVSELNSPSHMHILVRSAMNCSLEKNPGTRDSAGLLFHKLIKAGHLSTEKFIAGVKEVLEYADDMALDVPMIWKYLGEIIGATFRDNLLSIKVLADMMEPVKAARKAGDLMAEILLTVVKLTSVDVVGEMWQSSGFTWDMFLPSGKNVQEFVNNKKLGFTLSTGASTTTNSGGDANANDLSDEDFESLIKRELGSILATSDNVNDKVFYWIQKNLNISSPEKQRLFIRALVTVVVQSTIQGDKAESCRMNHDLLNVRTAILKRYINNDNNLELQALYAVQALNQHLESPPRLLGLIFNVLYDEDVIPEETFYAWQKSSDPNESVGKGVALKSVTSFFDWLRLAEEEPAK